MGFIKRRDPNKHPGILTTSVARYSAMYPVNESPEHAVGRLIFGIALVRAAKLPDTGRSLPFTGGPGPRSSSAPTSKSSYGGEFLMIG